MNRAGCFRPPHNQGRSDHNDYVQRYDDVHEYEDVEIKVQRPAVTEDGPYEFVSLEPSTSRPRTDREANGHANLTRARSPRTDQSRPVPSSATMSTTKFGRKHFISLLVFVLVMILAVSTGFVLLYQKIREQDVSSMDITALISADEKLNATIQLQQKEIKPLKMANDAINASVNFQQRAVNSFKESVKTIKKEIEPLKTANDVIERKIYDQKNDIESLKKSKISLKKEIEPLKTANDAIERIIHSQQSDIKNLKKSLNSLRQDIQSGRAKFQEKIDDMESRIISLIPNCDIVYSNVCYWMDIHSSDDTTLAEAESICGQQKSSVADVVDQTQYELLVEKIRSKIRNDLRNVRLWTGLKQNPSTGVVTLSSGARAPYLKWFPGNPGRTSSETNIFLVTPKNAMSSNHGMCDIHPTYNVRGVLCQYKPQ